MGDLQGLRMPLDSEAVEAYLKDADFKAELDLFVTTFWPTYIAGLKIKSAVRMEERASAIARAEGHPSQPTLRLLEGGHGAGDRRS